MDHLSLTDPFGRRIDYLRLSVTDRCDLRCGYCLPKGFKGFEKPANWLSFDEIVRVVGAFTTLGVRRVRLTGGEPLMRRMLPDLAARLSALPGLDDLSLSSNCTQMAEQARALADAGVRRLNVSLDSLRAKVFRQITGGDLCQVLRGIAAAAEAGMQPIRVNTVVMPGVNDDEIEDILDYCASHGFTLRLIETMPLGPSGQRVAGALGSLEPIKRRLARQFELIPDILPGGGPARYYRVGTTETRIGFITPLSRHFCATCNRVRLAVDGTLYLCLGQEHSLPVREHLRAGLGETELRELIRQAIALKPEHHNFNEQPGKIVRVMSMTGG
ncbi:Cyclic pyranopterin monophosphate synthase [Thiorhodovibrio winogradskyi]|uniref:GTP 3',8-cyclase n=1 Tax=Thiorhodovibrio winogradskyi TaxID=77007 RepID=A0ABZ0S998_9GAMM|nr:GTP 3',8-cyclase MoaA [Thiorhodovibrio winogradskyi]